jgi:glycosyltransferase involved in cell wall biosynthesis
MTTVAHLTASPFYGGPERQMLGLAEHLRPAIRTVFLSFAEVGNARAFLGESSRRGFDALALDHDTPHFRAAIAELVDRLGALSVDVLFCHGYKSSLLGRMAARRAGISVVAVSRGWTYESLKIRAFELLDRINLRWMDRVVCVSQGQAAKVRRAGVPARKVVVIPNAIDAARFEDPDPAARGELEQLLPRPFGRIVGAVGRLSPEKGFSVLVDAAARVAQGDPDAGFVLFGDGALRPALSGQIAARGLADRFVLAGFRRDLDRLLPALDLLVQSSYTEGMPNVVLEACAAGVPVVATAVGGTPEILVDGEGGLLVPPGDPVRLAGVIRALLADATRCRLLGEAGRRRILAIFTFGSQATRYRGLLDEVLGRDAASLDRREPVPTTAAIGPAGHRLAR